MDRRAFVRLGVAAGTGSLLSLPRIGSSAIRETRFLTERVVTVLLGGERPTYASNAFEALAAEGTLFTRDVGVRTTVRGYVHSGILSGRVERSQRPDFPTWNEVVRKTRGESASMFWMIQSASYHDAWSWDVKHYSRHPDYGIRYGATNLTMSKIIGAGLKRSPEAIVDLNVERGIGHSRDERRKLVDFIGTLPKACAAMGNDPHERPVVVGDRQSLVAGAEVLRRFAPRLVTIQLLGLADAGGSIAGLWQFIRSEPTLRDTTALVIRPTTGDDEPGSDWTVAIGPDFKRGRVIPEPVDARDLAPTLTYLMTGSVSEHADGRIRAQLFDAR